ncbi:hypothetical protein Kfla_4423 [Kribbella flavida DSM 17836]|uniref:Uncharacterized protein n=1 Tax=Kribbella flavida (strain DSM 17836 / JCM 10339 / NBRC 14399) TaxID=479435 RepID=D2PWI7_KRIFD|nr:hypothetical protein Kfla_4423 [Kribbella flavida DSM 17836]
MIHTFHLTGVALPIGRSYVRRTYIRTRVIQAPCWNLVEDIA